MKTFITILALLILSNTAFCQETEASKNASKEYQDFVEDMFDDEEEEDDLNSQNRQFNMPSDEDILKFRYAMRNLGGSFGTYFRTLENTYALTQEDCSKTYTCMVNFLLKLETIVHLENRLQENISCKDRQIRIEDYILFIGMINLDIYCIDHLHPDNDNLTDEAIVDVMLAMSEANESTLGRYLDFKSYKDIRNYAQPNCANDLEENCSCGEFIGTLDLNQKNIVLKDLRTLIDAINPFWQAQKALQLNQELQTITPCAK
ncbi:MAG: hypothetical protein R3359_10310 [Marinirhabdus sp.]|nr:hypothetical protein [Marinirhabdus sp.]